MMDLYHLMTLSGEKLSNASTFFNYIFNHKNYLTMKIKLTLFSVALAAVAFNCTNEDLKVDSVDSMPVTKTENAIIGDNTITFNRSNQNYTNSLAASDFGNVDDLREAVNAKNESNNLKVRIPRNTHSDRDATDGSGDGLRFNVDISDSDGYELTYKLKFGSNFKFSRGGKIGPGLVIGVGSSGCLKKNGNPIPAPEDGAGARFMWYSPDGDYNTESSNVFFQPYLYFVDQQPGDCGETFDKRSVKLIKDKWYTLYMKVKANTGTSSNGEITMKVDGVTLFSDTSFRWTKTTSVSESRRKIREMSFNVFRGGSDNDWISTTDGDVFFDDIVINKL
jgi:hypothetical protein